MSPSAMPTFSPPRSHTSSSSPSPPSTASLALPRILCLHGGGVTAEIFRLQSRSLIASLSPHFRLVFADGPFYCPAGPGMIPVYAAYGPYRRWLRWLPEHVAVDDDVAIEEVEYALRTAMEGDEGSGEWVGLMGFSQGAKVVASVLFETQLRLEERRETKRVNDLQRRKERGMARREEVGLDGMYGGRMMEDGEEEEEAGETEEEEDDDDDEYTTDAQGRGIGFAGGSWRFAVCLAGRAPLVMLSERRTTSPTMIRPGGISEGFDFDAAGINTDKLRLPSLHVHGLADPGLHLHRRLLNDYCVPGSAKVVEWPGDHRIPLKSADVGPIVDAILELAKTAGVSIASRPK